MGTKELLRDFVRPSEVMGADPVLSKERAFRCVEFCRQNDLAVLGMECFWLIDGKREPILEAIGDWSAMAEPSWEAFRDDCNFEAEAFLRSVMPDAPEVVVAPAVTSRREAEPKP